MKIRTILLAVTAMTALSFSTVVLNESFDSDNGNWNGLLGATYTISGGQLSIPSTTSTGIKWVVGIAPVLTDLSLSVEAAFQSPDTNARLGFTFRTQDNLDSYHFYVYPTGEYIAYKYIAGIWTDYSNHIRVGNSFIRSDRNLLKLVCDGDNLTFLCNGQKLAAVTDASLRDSGRVGLVASGIVTGLFDNLILDNAPVADNGLSSFSDDFSNAGLTGWRNYSGRGAFQVESGKLKCTSENSSNFSLIQSDGDYGTADTVFVSTEKVAPVPAGTYLFGLMFHYAVVPTGPTTVSTRSYIFCIVNGSHHVLLKQEGSAITQLYAPQPSLSIQAANNTLKVVNAAGGSKDLYINNTKVHTLTDAAFPSGGVGLVANGNAIINFDNFRVTSQSAVAAENIRGPLTGRFALSAAPNPFHSTVRLTVGAPAGAASRLAVYDMSGREVFFCPAKGEAEIRWDASRLPSGLYTARITRNGRSLSRTLILVR